MSDAFAKRMAAARTRAAARKQRAAMASGQDRITIIGPQADGTYIVEFRTARRDGCDLDPARRDRGDRVFQSANWP
jgi:hypothetical protein